MAICSVGAGMLAQPAMKIATATVMTSLCIIGYDLRGKKFFIIFLIHWVKRRTLSLQGISMVIATGLHFSISNQNEGEYFAWLFCLFL
jgi:hypothetical protein